MAPAKQDVDLAKRAKVIEWLKTEILDHVSRLFKGIWDASNERIADSLASLIVLCYVLGRRLGISFVSMDEAIAEKLRKHQEDGHQLEDWYQDLSSLEQHMRKR